MEIKPSKRALEKELQSLIQAKLNEFIAQTGTHPHDIKINLISFKTDDGQIDIVVDEVEIDIDSMTPLEGRHDLH